jgi:RNA recognition motif-containing protein
VPLINCFVPAIKIRFQVYVPFRCAGLRKESILGKKLYVGSLSYSTSEATLERVFAQAGRVESVRLIMDRDTGRPKGFGFVEMSTNEEAQQAINMLNGFSLDGRAIIVNEARPQESRGGGGGGGGFSQDRRGGGGGGGGGRGGYRY